MPNLIHPDSNERVRATRDGAEILREQGYVDADPASAVGGPAGVPAAERVIVDNLRAGDWDGASLRRLRRFVASGGRRYAEAVLRYERDHQNRDAVIDLIEARLEELPDPDVNEPPEPRPHFPGRVVGDPMNGGSDEGSGRPAKSASREDWNAYAQGLGIDPEEHSSKDDLIAAVDAKEAERNG